MSTSNVSEQWRVRILIAAMYLCQCILLSTGKSIRLNTTNANTNGANITILSPDDVNINTTWNLISRHQTGTGYHMQIDLDQTWGFTADSVSAITLTIDGPEDLLSHNETSNNENTDLDLLIKISTDASEYVKIRLSLDNQASNTMTPECARPPTHPPKLLTYNTNVTSGYNTISPSNRNNDYDNQWPIIITLVNNPINDNVQVIITNEEWLVDDFQQKCDFSSSFSTDVGLQIYIGIDDNGKDDEIISLSTIHIDDFVLDGIDYKPDLEFLADVTQSTPAPSALTADPECEYGLNDEAACCHPWCGTCGGSGCGRRNATVWPDGSEDYCCANVIKKETCPPKYCDNNTAPCIISSYVHSGSDTTEPPTCDLSANITTTPSPTIQPTTIQPTAHIVDTIATTKIKTNNIVELIESNWIYIFLFFLAIVGLFCCIVCLLLILIRRLKNENRKRLKAFGIGVEGDSDRSRADSVSMTDMRYPNPSEHKHSHYSHHSDVHRPNSHKSSSVNINLNHNNGSINVFVMNQNDHQNERRYSNSNSENQNQSYPVSSPDGPQPGYLDEPDHYKMRSIMSDMYGSPRSRSEISRHEGDTITNDDEFFGKVTTLGNIVRVPPKVSDDPHEQQGNMDTNDGTQGGMGASGLDILRNLADPNTSK